MLPRFDQLPTGDKPFAMGRGIRACSTALALAAGAAFAPSAAAAPPAPFGHPCEPRDGVLVCPTRTLADRVPSFDGTPLDADVTLPAGARAGRPLPTVAMLHGYGGSKADFEADARRYARRGYAVLTYSARGFARSCGKEEGSAATPDCLARKSYVHLADQRWEARDAQHLLGLRVDQQVSGGDSLGVTGISYGGGVARPGASSRSPRPTHAGPGPTSSTRFCRTAAISTRASRARGRAAIRSGS